MSTKNEGLTGSELSIVMLGFAGFVAMLFLLPLALPLLGAFGGWVLSLTPIGGWVVAGLGSLGFTGVTTSSLPFVGAALGFLAIGFKGINVNRK